MPVYKQWYCRNCCLILKLTKFSLVDVIHGKKWELPWYIPFMMYVVDLGMWYLFVVVAENACDSCILLVELDMKWECQIESDIKGEPSNHEMKRMIVNHALSFDDCRRQGLKNYFYSQKMWGYILAFVLRVYSSHLLQLFCIVACLCSYGK